MFKDEVFIKAAVDNDHDSKMMIGKKVFELYNSGIYQNLLEKLVFSMDIRHIAYSISNVDEVETYVRNFFAAADNGLIERSKIGKAYKKASLEKYVSENPLPNYLVFSNDYAEFIYNYEKKFYYGVAIRYYNISEAIMQINERLVSSLVGECYEYYLANDEMCKLNKEAYDHYEELRCLDLKCLANIGTSSIHHGTLILFNRKNEDESEDRYLTKDELETVIQNCKVIKAAISTFDEVSCHPISY